MKGEKELSDIATTIREFLAEPDVHEDSHRSLPAKGMRCYMFRMLDEIERLQERNALLTRDLEEIRLAWEQGKVAIAAEQTLITAAIQWYHAEKARDDWDEAIASGAKGMGGDKEWREAQRQKWILHERFYTAENDLRSAAAALPQEREKKG